MAATGISPISTRARISRRRRRCPSPYSARVAQSIRAWRQARRSPGVLGVTLRAQPLRLSYWTLSAWTGQDALDAFARAEPHRTIMRRVRPWAKTATFRFWTADAAQLSPDRLWAEAERRISGPED